MAVEIEYKKIWGQGRHYGDVVIHVYELVFDQGASWCNAQRNERFAIYGNG